MDPHPLANLFKRSNYVDPIASELSALDYLYGVLLEMRESENCEEEIYEVIHEGSLDEKHDCNGFTINSISDNHAKNMQNPKLGDASFAMSTTCCNDHDWGDDFSYDLENLFKPHDEYDICNNIESGFGEVMTLVDDNPTIFEERQLCMHVDHEKNILCDSYIVEFEYDPTCNYYERGKYGGRNFHITKSPLVMLRLLLSLSSSLHMVTIGCLDNLFSYKMPMHRKYVRLRCDFHMLYDALVVLQFLSFV